MERNMLYVLCLTASGAGGAFSISGSLGAIIFFLTWQEGACSFFPRASLISLQAVWLSTPYIFPYRESMPPLSPHLLHLNTFFFRFRLSLPFVSPQKGQSASRLTAFLCLMRRFSRYATSLMVKGKS